MTWWEEYKTGFVRVFFTQNIVIVCVTLTGPVTLLSLTTAVLIFKIMWLD